MSKTSSEISFEEIKTKKEKRPQFAPSMAIKCPNAPIIQIDLDPSKNPKKKLSRLFLIHNIKELHRGYELSLKGVAVFRQIGRRVADSDLPSIFSYLEEEEIFSLDLSHNAITNEGFDTLCEFLLYSKLKNLNLRHNDITALSERGCEILGKTTSLKRLTLSGNQLLPESAEKLKEVLKANKTLDVLELDSVDFYVNSINRITDMLVHYNNTLRVLNISRLLGIPRYRLRSYYLSDIIYNLLVANNSLIELHLEKNGITDHDVEKIAEALKINRTLCLINLTANYISNVGLEKIAAILPISRLQALLLRSNTVGNQGAIALSKTMPLSKIVHLDIAYNRIGELGLANLLWTIKKPIPLNTFYIFGNNITKQILEIIHVQMLRGKILSDSLDLILYWEEDGGIRCSYNPDANEYRNQMAGLYDGGHIAPKENILPYPIVNVLHYYETLQRDIEYPKGCDPKILCHYKDHIAVK